MSPGRNRHSHKLKSTTSPIHRAAAIAAPLVTVVAVGVGLSVVGSATPARTAPAAASARGAVPAAGVVLRAPQRRPNVSRSSDRLKALAREGKVTRKKLTRFATSPLKVRATPTANADVARVVEPGTRLIATGIRQGGFAEVRFDDHFRWVTAEYLSPDKPPKPPTASKSPNRAAAQTLGLSDAPCPDGAVDNGLTSGAVRVYRAVCHSFPQITSYGGYAPRGEHASGKAIDIMTSDVTLGTQIADFLRAHASELNLYDVIWRQRIWTPVRSSEGFRSMPDRGSATANHYDHVHVSVN